jgi:hypothetical protein
VGGARRGSARCAPDCGGERPERGRSGLIGADPDLVVVSFLL